MASSDNGKKAFIMGYTGATGSEILEALAKKNVFSEVVLIGRRKVEFENEEMKKWEQRVVDFDNLSQHEEDFKGFDVGFCSIGTTTAKSNKDEYYKIDHDYVVNSAKLAKAGGCRDFHHVSSAGADKNSMVSYLKLKKEIEDDLADVGFERLCIYRPKMLLGKRQERRIGECVMKVLLKPVTALSPTSLSVPTELVAKAMLNFSLKKIEKPVEIIDNVACHNLGKSFE